MTHKEIQDDIVKRYRITLDEHSRCWRRTHAHIKERRVCKWHPSNSIQSTFDLLHEVGHIETTKSWMRRCESEYYATQWAIEKAKEYGLKIPQRIIEDYQNYIDMELDRGLRRSGTGYTNKMILKG